MFVGGDLLLLRNGLRIAIDAGVLMRLARSLSLRLAAFLRRFALLCVAL